MKYTVWDFYKKSGNSLIQILLIFIIIYIPAYNGYFCLFKGFYWGNPGDLVDVELSSICPAVCGWMLIKLKEVTSFFMSDWFARLWLGNLVLAPTLEMIELSSNKFILPISDKLCLNIWFHMRIIDFWWNSALK